VKERPVGARSGRRVFPLEGSGRRPTTSKICALRRRFRFHRRACGPRTSRVHVAPGAAATLRDPRTVDAVPLPARPPVPVRVADSGARMSREHGAARYAPGVPPAGARARSCRRQAIHPPDRTRHPAPDGGDSQESGRHRSASGRPGARVAMIVWQRSRRNGESSSRRHGRVGEQGRERIACRSVPSTMTKRERTPARTPRREKGCHQRFPATPIECPFRVGSAHGRLQQGPSVFLRSPDDESSLPLHGFIRW
jgi:hypothetical protein